MRAIERAKHIRLLECLEELRSLAADPLETARIESQIKELSTIYDRYRQHLQDASTLSERYNTLHERIRNKAYKQLRQAHRTAVAALGVTIT